MAEPRNYCLRISYRLDGEEYLEYFWTTKRVLDGLTKGKPESVEFAKALKILNPQLRYRQGLGARDWNFEVRPVDILEPPALSGIKEPAYPGQERLFGYKAEMKGRYFKPSHNPDAKKKSE